MTVIVKYLKVCHGAEVVNVICIAPEKFLMRELKKKKVERKGQKKNSTLHKEKITFRLNPGRKWSNEFASSVSVPEGMMAG